VAWFSYFPVEWLPDASEEVRALPRQHPATWQRVLLAELEKIPDLTIHVLVLRKQFPHNITFQRGRTVFHLIKTPGGLRAPSLFWLDTLLIRRELRKIQPGLVHAWGTEHGAALVASRLDYPSLVTVQGLTTWIARTFAVPPYERIVAWLEDVSLRRATVATAESTFSTEYLRQRYPQLEVRRIDVVPDALFHSARREPVSSPRRLLFIGGLGPRKGGDTLLQALNQAKLPVPVELMVIGAADPGFLETVSNRVTPELRSRIRFRQGLSSQEVAEEMAKATLLVCPTRADTGPMAVKEAVVAGVPVVGTRVGGVPDYVVPGRNGLLFPVGDAGACAGALSDALGHPLFGRGQVEQALLQEMRLRLEPARMAKVFFETYKEVCSQKP
jgi:glycosyltransferase involved in cell wall biosynthesis